MLRYLSRYTHKIAISNHRIVGMEDTRVHFRYKDYRDDDRVKVMALEAEAFLQRFLCHVLPQGFMRVRHFGFLANRCRRQKLKQIRWALREPEIQAADEETRSHRDQAGLVQNAGKGVYTPLQKSHRSGSRGDDMR